MNPNEPISAQGNLVLDSHWRMYPEGAGRATNPISFRYHGSHPMRAIALKQYRIPFRFLVFDAARHSFEVTETTGPATFTVTLANETSRNGTDLAASLQTTLRAASVVGGNSWLYVVTWDGDAQTLTIYSGGAGQTYTITFATGASATTHTEATYDVNDVYEVLGFGKTDLTVANTQVGFGPNFAGPLFMTCTLSMVNRDKLLLCSHDPNSRNVTFVITPTQETEHTDTGGTYFLWENRLERPDYTYLGGTEGSTLGPFTVTWRYPNGNIIDFEGKNWLAILSILFNASSLVGFSSEHHV
ncbi:MAG: hypothetical protein GY845_35450 [Planctomycetes bacterium]|nr:hypothetical protein [Planctomycetota bacterium]